MVPTLALPYSPAGLPYPKVPPKLLVPSANEPPAEICIGPLENDGMPAQACAAAFDPSRKGSANVRMKNAPHGCLHDCGWSRPSPDQVHPHHRGLGAR